MHLCHFYPQRQDLVDGLLPYFIAGLKNNERCVWVTEDPLPADEARAELMRRVPEIGQVDGDRLQIVDASKWYGPAGGYDASDLVNLLLEAEKSALADGYKGLRVSGNTSFLQEADWDAFMAYERSLTSLLEGRRILALCSYHLARCRPTDFLDVVRHHHFTLDRADESGWQVRRHTDELPLSAMVLRDR